MRLSQPIASKPTVRILGIDPGSRITGYGIIDVCGQKNTHIASGCIRMNTDDDLANRCRQIYDQINDLVHEYSPHEVAVEKVFMNKNADSALKLGQARGAALVAAMQGEISVFEYTPTRIKQALVGRGHADKTQVQHMVRLLLNLQDELQADQADALAAAICHGNSRQTALLLKQQA